MGINPQFQSRCSLSRSYLSPRWTLLAFPKNFLIQGNEVEVGQGIARAIESGNVKREDLWVTSKLWNTFHEPQHVRPACLKTLKDLGLDYLDLYLIHFPISLKYVPFEKRYPPEWFHDPNVEDPKMELISVPIQSTWEAMEALVKEGLVKNIGVSNFSCQGIRDLMSYANIKPAVLQVELHPYLQQGLFEKAKFSLETNFYK